MGAIGVDHDRVSLVLNGESVLIAESYDIQQGIFSQPAAFAIRMGWGEKMRELMAKYPPSTPFQLLVDGAVQFSGKTDGYMVDQSSGASQITIKGRDVLAAVHDGYVRSEVSFSDITYADLVRKVLDETVKGDYAIEFSNEANRKAVAKIPTSGSSAGSTTKTAAAIAAEALISSVSTASVEASGVTPTSENTSNQSIEQGLEQDGVLTQPAQQARTLQVKMGHTWYQFLKPELDRAGLVLWASASGNFVLAKPDTKQAPVARIVRKRGQLRNQVTVLEASHTNDTSKRYSECLVHFRRGGGSESRGRGLGQCIDEEMQGLGFDKPMVHHDQTCKTLMQADILAKRLVSESRRAGWQLQYTVAGHTVEGIGGGRITWTPDTMIEVDDDELGIKGLFYLENANKSRRPQTVTVLNLMRPTDLLFGENG